MFVVVTDYIRSTKVTKTCKVKRFSSTELATLDDARDFYKATMRHARKDPHVAIVNITVYHDGQVHWSLR